MMGLVIGLLVFGSLAQVSEDWGWGVGEGGG